MSKLWLIGLAASAAWTPAAIAQGAPPQPPAPPPMAYGAHAPGGHGGHGAMIRHGGGGHRVMPPGMPGRGGMKGGGYMGGHMKGMPGGHHMGGMKGKPGGHYWGGMKGKPGGHHMGGMKGKPGGHHMGGMKGKPGGHHMGGMKGWKRFGRGHIVPHHFRNRQFFVHDWRSFGWPAPMPGGNWIRYYDDALLIDGHGRVMDSRYGWDWEGRGGHMAYDDGGYDEGYSDDYAESDYERDDYGYDDDGDDCGEGCGPVGHLPPPHPGYGHGSGYGSAYGYGYGYGAGCACGPVVVTETTTTTAPVVETHTYYETVYEHRAAPRRHYKKPVVRRSVKPAYRVPAPRPGERG